MYQSKFTITLSALVLLAVSHHASARFISEDPKGFEAGDANFYAYCGNNPVNCNDPMGLEAYLGAKPIDAPWPANNANHTVIVLIPNNPNDFTNRWIPFASAPHKVKQQGMTGDSDSVRSATPPTHQKGNPPCPTHSLPQKNAM